MNALLKLGHTGDLETFLQMMQGYGLLATVNAQDPDMLLAMVQDQLRRCPPMTPDSMRSDAGGGACEDA